MDDRTVRITLEVDAGSDPIVGRAVDGAGRERAFSNWLGLIATVDDLHRDGLLPRPDAAREAGPSSPPHAC